MDIQLSLGHLEPNAIVCIRHCLRLSLHLHDDGDVVDVVVLLLRCNHNIHNHNNRSATTGTSICSTRG